MLKLIGAITYVATSLQYSEKRRLFFATKQYKITSPLIEVRIALATRHRCFEYNQELTKCCSTQQSIMSGFKIGLFYTLFGIVQTTVSRVLRPPLIFIITYTLQLMCLQIREMFWDFTVTDTFCSHLLQLVLHTQVLRLETSVLRSTLVSRNKNWVLHLTQK